MDLAFHTVAAALLLRIGYIDWRQRRIANRDVVAIALVAGLGAALTRPATGIMASCAVALALSLPGFLLGRLGGGDVKLLVAMAPLWSIVELLAIFAGGIIAICMMLPAFSRRYVLATSGEDRQQYTPAGIPLGTAMMLGTFGFLVMELLQHG
jgi:prepilin peptidase CpaA